MAIRWYHILRFLGSQHTQRLMVLLIFLVTFMYSAVKSSKKRNEEASYEKRKVNPEDTFIPWKDLISDNSSWREIQEERKKEISEKCQHIPLDLLRLAILKNKYSRRHMLFDDELKVIFCAIPKVASVEWRRSWLHRTNPKLNVKRFERRRIDEMLVNNTLKGILPKKELEDKLSRYKKIIVVRHPLERLLSVYLDEVNSPPVGYNVLRFVRKTRPDAEFPSITWPEFVNYIVKDGVINSDYFFPYEDICHPCAISYDFIVRYESFKEDSENSYKQIGVTSAQRFMEPPPYDSKVNSSVLQRYLSMLSPIHLKSLRRKYDRDLKLFQYS